MDYEKIHNEIIRRAKSDNRNKQTGIFELHHIIPRSFGGDDSPGNLVLLTPKEHFIIHVLLWKINPCKKTNDPILYFKQKGAKNSRLYQMARQNHIVYMKLDNPSKHLSEESKRRKSIKLSEYASNRTKEHNKKISEAKQGQQIRLGATLEEESKLKISESLKQYYINNPVSQETKDKLKLANTGKTHSEASIDKMRNSAVNRKRYTCEICGKNNLDGGNFTLHLKNKHQITDKEKIEEMKK